jgi:hypothetical protein
MTCDLYEQVMGHVLDAAEVRYFTAKELCPVGKKANGTGLALQAPPSALFKNIIQTVKVADWLRERVGPLIVLSGWRDPEYNKAIGGAPASLHMEFCALDLRPVRVTPDELADLAETHPAAKQLGLGIYPRSGFLHLDTRGLIGRSAPARWVG